MAIISTLLSVSVFAAVALAWSPNVPAALKCISENYDLYDLTIITRSTPGYSDASKPYNLRLKTDPSIIVVPTSVDQIKGVVKCAADAGLSVSAKSGGHSYAAYGLSGDLVVDMKNLKDITLNEDGTAVVQTGNRLGEVATSIFDMGGRALPHGSCPYVGSGGHTLYGGFGYLGRIAGLLVDTVVSAEVVLADGSLVTASNTSNTDLFFAVRGGGPSFGLVTAWTYQTVLAPYTTINYNISFTEQLTVPEMASAYAAWEAFGTTAPNELAMAAFFKPIPIRPGTVSMSFGANYYGTEKDFRSLIKPFLDRLPTSAKLTVNPFGWIKGLIAFANNKGTLDTSQPDRHDTFFTKSIVTTQPDSNASITSWISYMADKGSRSDTEWFAQVDLYGGGKSAINAVPPDETAFAHRNAFLVYQLYASSESKPYPEDGIPFVAGMATALVAYPTGAYPNYIDPSLSRSEWQLQYFGKHVERLEKIKKQVDPKNVFRFQQGF